jgi:Kdo2-lipid IVA lauroyltransferase/acyltransferase
MLRRLYKRSPLLRRRALRVKDAATFRLAQAALGVAARYPLDTALAAADRVGDLAFRTLHRTRNRSLEHLELVFGNTLSDADRRDITRLCLRNFARAFCEIAKMEEIRPRFDDYVEVRGWEDVAPHLDGGAIICSGHLGNWELLASYFALVKRLRVAAVARRVGEARLNQLLVDFRADNGVETILRESPTAGRQMLATLKNRGMLAMLVDQDTHVPSITVPFLGRPARTPVAPAALAMRRHLPVIVAYSLRRPGGGLQLVVEKPLFAEAGEERDTAILSLTRRVNELLGDAIRNNPTQWPWWHRRWRRPPQPRLDPDAPIT